MDEQVKSCHPYTDYPWYVIALRWAMLLTTFILGIYLLYQLGPMVAWFYVFYGVLGLTLILPLSRCVYCHYYGKWCNAGWGKVAEQLFRKEDEEKYVNKYAFAILLYPLWLFPLLVGIILLLRGRDLKSLIFLAAYVLLLFAEKMVLKVVACTFCHQKEFCPALPFRDEHQRSRI